MAYDKENRRLYIEQKADGTKVGIALWEIADCIRDYRVNKKGNRDLGMLCTSDKVNPFARYRPVPHPTTSEITNQQREDVDYGLDCTITEHQHEWTWRDVKLTPKVMTPPYRIKDFAGYSHTESFGLGIKTEDNTNLSYDALHKIRVQGDTLYNIGFPQTKHIVSKALSGLGESLESWGIMVYDDMGLNKIEFNGGDLENYDPNDIVQAFQRYNPNNGINWFKNCIPPWHDARVAVYWKDATGFYYLLEPRIVPYKTFQYKTPIANYFSSRSVITTNERKTGMVLGNTLTEAISVRGGSGSRWDEVCLTCRIDYDGDPDIKDVPLSWFYLKITTTSNNSASVERKTAFQQLAFPNVNSSFLAAGESIGNDYYPELVGGKYPNITDTKDIACYFNTRALYNSTELASWWSTSDLEVSIQLVLLPNAILGTNKYRILTPPTTAHFKMEKDSALRYDPQFTFKELDLKVGGWTQE